MKWAEAGVNHSQISPASGDAADLPSNVDTRSGPTVEDNRASCAQDILLPLTYAYFTGLKDEFLSETGWNKDCQV